MTTQRPALSRRTVMRGLGAAGGALAIGAAAAPASARQSSVQGPQSPAGKLHPHTVPGGVAPISSQPEFGVAYQFRSWLDFTPEDNLLFGRKFGGGGFYTSGASDYLAATFDLPTGASLHDLEWYVSNSVPANVYANVWQTSQAVLDTFWSTSIPAGSGVRASKFVIPSTVNGPYPHGTRLMVAVSSPSDGSVQINGVRAGFRHAPLSTVLRTSSVRVYDSRSSGGPLHSGHSRTISLAPHVPSNAAGAILLVSLVHTVRAGNLKVYAAGTPAPAAGVLNWFATSQTISNEITTAVSLDSRVTVLAGGGHQTNFVVDVVGYLV